MIEPPCHSRIVELQINLDTCCCSLLLLYAISISLTLFTIPFSVAVGKFVAEAKFNDPKLHDQYVHLIKTKDRHEILQLLTNVSVEQKLLGRLKKKALLYGQEIDDSNLDEYGDGNVHVHSRISPSVVARIYEQFVIPLTKEVEVEYLMQRLDLVD